VAGASVSQAGAITVAHETVSGTELTLLVQGKQLYGPPRHRDANFTFADDPPDVEDDEGNIMSEGGSASILHRVAEGGRPSLAVDSDWAPTCVRLMVAGTATPRVAKLRVRHADGSATPIRLRVAPAGWHYSGHYFGAFVRVGSAPRSIRAFDRNGDLVRAIKLPRRPICDQPTG
jgi:hypothetical protein